MTLRQKCVNTLRENGGSGSVAYVTATIGGPRGLINATLIYLTDTGWLKRIGRGAYQVIREGVPHDKRRSVNKPRAIEHPMPKHATALEAALGWIPKRESRDE